VSPSVAIRTSAGTCDFSALVFYFIQALCAGIFFFFSNQHFRARWRPTASQRGRPFNLSLGRRHRIFFFYYFFPLVGTRALKRVWTSTRAIRGGPEGGRGPTRSPLSYRGSNETIGIRRRGGRPLELNLLFLGAGGAARPFRSSSREKTWARHWADHPSTGWGVLGKNNPWAFFRSPVLGAGTFRGLGNTWPLDFRPFFGRLLPSLGQDIYENRWRFESPKNRFFAPPPPHSSRGLGRSKKLAAIISFFTHHTVFFWFFSFFVV